MKLEYLAGFSFCVHLHYTGIDRPGILRGFTLIQVARRRSKVFQRFSASLVRVGDVQGVSRRHAVRGKKDHHLLGRENFHLSGRN